MRDPRPIQHRPRLLRPLLQPPEGLGDVPRLDGGLALAGGVEQALRELALLGAGGLLAALGALQAGLLLLDVEGDLGQGLDHLKGQEAEDVDDVVRGPRVGDDAEAGPLAEALALAEGEGGLAVLGPGDVLLLGHGLCALVGLLQALQGDVVHLLLLLVLLVLALGHVLVVEGRRLPRQAGPGGARLLDAGVVGGPAGARDDAAGDGVLAGAEVGLAALLVRVLGGLADVFPGEEGAEAGDLGLVVADLEDEVVDGDGAGAAAGGEVGAVAELVEVVSKGIRARGPE
jgi:hypothetical protein